MSFKESLAKSLANFGRSTNAAGIVSMSVAASKGIFRPIFTMSDKKESYETKKYTALREGLTELIAIPMYFVFSMVLPKKVAAGLAKPKNFMSKDMFQKYSAGDRSAEVVNAYTHADELAKINFKKIKTTSGFAGVCLCALFVIPAVCSLTIKPIMKKLDKREPNEKVKKQEVLTENQPSVNPVKQPAFNGIRAVRNYGMKVGGV